MKLHNTLTRSLETITPLSGNTITMYSCGPTVYDYQHIGNYASYIRWDILARTLRASGYDLNWYINITDVGHLVSDADDGEDKLEKGARREGKTAWEVAEYYTKDYLNTLDALHISVDRSHLTKATDHIEQQIALVKVLEERGHTYTIDDGVYFDSTTFADYGKMARLDLEGQQAGKRVDLGQKRHGSDFALWKFSPHGEQRDMEWDSPWGVGFPGWHVECSAMAMYYLGESIDIHTGGIDHIPVHHTNEIAQSEAATGKRFVSTWVHGNFIKVDGTKMSKSLRNIYTLDDVIAKGFLAEDFKFLILQSHYQTEANFTWEALQAASSRRKVLQGFADLRFQITEQSVTPLDYEALRSSLLEALQNDISTPQALEALNDAIDSRTDGIHITEQSDFIGLIGYIDELLGLQLGSSLNITASQKELINERQTARDAKDWTVSDSIRDTLLTENIGVRDTPNGPIWYRI